MKGDAARGTDEEGNLARRGGPYFRIGFLRRPQLEIRLPHTMKVHHRDVTRRPVGCNGDGTACLSRAVLRPLVKLLLSDQFGNGACEPTAFASTRRRRSQAEMGLSLPRVMLLARYPLLHVQHLHGIAASRS